MCLVVNIHDIFFPDIYNDVLLRIAATRDLTSDCKKAPLSRGDKKIGYATV